MRETSQKNNDNLRSDTHLLTRACKLKIISIYDTKNLANNTMSKRNYSPSSSPPGAERKIARPNDAEREEDYNPFALLPDELKDNIAEQGLSQADIVNLRNSTPPAALTSNQKFRDLERGLNAFTTGPHTLEAILRRLQTRPPYDRGMPHVGKLYAMNTDVDTVLNNLFEAKYKYYTPEEADVASSRMLVSDLLDILYSVYVANPFITPRLLYGSDVTSFEARQAKDGFRFEWSRVPFAEHQYLEIVTHNQELTLKVKDNAILEPFLTRPTCKLVQPITALDTLLRVDNASAIDEFKTYIKIDNEYMKIEEIHGNDFTVSRNSYHSQPHEAGATITRLSFTLFETIKAFYDLNESIKRGQNAHDSITIAHNHYKAPTETLIQILKGSNLLYDRDVPAVYARASFIDLAA